MQERAVSDKMADIAEVRRRWHELKRAYKAMNDAMSKLEAELASAQP